MATYSEIVETIRNFLVAQVTVITDATATISDLDSTVTELYKDKDTDVGVTIDFLYTEPHATDSGRAIRDRWDTYIGGIFVQQFVGRDGTETSKNALIDLLYHAFDGGSTKVLAGTDKVSIVRVERPDKMAIGEHAFYIMPFTLKVNHGGKE